MSGTNRPHKSKGNFRHRTFPQIKKKFYSTSKDPTYQNIMLGIERSLHQWVMSESNDPTYYNVKFDIILTIDPAHQKVTGMHKW